MLFCGRGFAIFPVSHAPKRWLGPLARAEDWCAEVTANIVRPVFGKISVIVQDDHFLFAFRGFPERDARGSAFALLPV